MLVEVGLVIRTIWTIHTLTDVSFSGSSTGESRDGVVSYINNSLTDVTFSGCVAGGSYSGLVSYIDNTLTDVTFSSWSAGGSEKSSVRLYQ